MTIDHNAIIDWSRRAITDMEETTAAAREAGSPLAQTGALIKEYRDIMAGRPLWQRRHAEQAMELPPEGHPLRALGVRLAELLDEDQWADCEDLLLEGWAHDRDEREMGGEWRKNSSLEAWFPFTAKEIAELKISRDLAESHADDNLRLARKLREGLQKIYMARGEDHLIASICSPLIEASESAA